MSLRGWCVCVAGCEGGVCVAGCEGGVFVLQVVKAVFVLQVMSVVFVLQVPHTTPRWCVPARCRWLEAGSTTWTTGSVCTWSLTRRSRFLSMSLRLAQVCGLVCKLVSFFLQMSIFL